MSSATKEEWKLIFSCPFCGGKLGVSVAGLERAERIEAPVEPAEPLTEAQRAYLTILYERLGKTPTMELAKLTKKEASELISALQEEIRTKQKEKKE